MDRTRGYKAAEIFDHISVLCESSIPKELDATEPCVGKAFRLMKFYK